MKRTRIRAHRPRWKPLKLKITAIDPQFLSVAVVLIMVACVVSVWQSPNFGGRPIFAFCFLCVFSIYAFWKLWRPWSHLRCLRALEIDAVDAMQGLEFEHYVATLLKHQGYQATVTRASGDLGVDVVARKDGVGYTVQCKRYKNGVPRTAISDAVAAKAHYHCTEAMVVTNRNFTKGAYELAKSTGCILVDREQLAKWVRDFRTGSNTKRSLGVDDSEPVVIEDTNSCKT